ncbi:hypothetical protein DXA19_15375 [Firmicutes bacterium AM59-13]|jgi:RNA-binding protein YhbY|nr:hypothetical protein DXA19_15375 [Firmicutes bacterium AM59-13]
MQTREIDLLDMIADVLSHWRGMIVALVLGAVLLGGVSYTRSFRTVQIAQQQEPVVQDEATVQTQLSQLERNLDAKSQAVVLTVLDDEKEYDLKKTYSENSIYMQLNPLQAAQTELIYQVQTADVSMDGQLGALYTSLLNNVGLYDWVAQQTGIEAGYVGELISAEPVSCLTIPSKEMTLGTNCVKVSILQSDTEACQKLAEAVKAYISEEQKQLNNELGQHVLVLVSETTGSVMNKDLMNDQIKCRNEIASLQSTIAATKADFTEEQKKYYELLTWEEAEHSEQPEQPAQNVTAEENPVPTPAVSKKYVSLGAVLFVFVYAVVICMVYIFNTKLRVSDELQSIYGIPQIGLVVRESCRKVFLDKWVDSLRHYGKRKFTAEQSMELAFAAIKIAAVKNGLNNICLMGCNMSAGADKVCESLKAALEKEQIGVSVLDNVLYDAEAMEKMDAMQGAVLVEKAGSTLYNEVAGELELLKRQDIRVLGGIIVE